MDFLYFLFILLLKLVFMNTQSLLYVDSNYNETNHDGTLQYPYQNLIDALNADNSSTNIILSLKPSPIPYEFQGGIPTQNSLRIVCFEYEFFLI